MGVELKTWERKQYQQGGGDALVFYVVYGKFSEPLKLSRSKYRSNGLPGGVTASRHQRAKNPKVFQDFQAGYLGKMLAEEQPELAEAINLSPECMVVRGTVTDPNSLDYLRDTVGFITAVLETGETGVFDPQRFTWWSPKEWQTEIFDPDGPVPRHHVAILVSEEEGDEGGEWVHTRGMRKFGRPDLSIHHVKTEHKEGIIDLCNRFIEMQAFGAIIPEGQTIKMAGLPPGITCHHGGNLEDPDFNNVHVELRWP